MQGLLHAAQRCLSCHIFYQASGHLLEHIHESLLVVTPCCCVALDVTPTSLFIVHRSSGPQPVLCDLLSMMRLFTFRSFVEEFREQNLSEGGVEVGTIAKRLGGADGTRLQRCHLQIAMVVARLEWQSSDARH